MKIFQRILFPWRRLSYDNSDTVAEWIASKSWRTLADWVVVGDLAPGVIATGTGTRINTLLIDTSSQLVTIRADNTLWATVRRSSLEGREACTHTYSINFSVLAVGSARIGIAWVSIKFNWLWWRYDLASGGWITRVAGVTCALCKLDCDFLPSIGHSSHRCQDMDPCTSLWNRQDGFNQTFCSQHTGHLCDL